ncbi:Transcription factor GRAS [Dillenia turbinata]|uniref:Transcription factor GRAS n=1 Tax=Dillenia turbinata TaxID=194707 RepID=A0AAN8V0Z0_9MAGN
MYGTQTPRNLTFLADVAVFVMMKSARSLEDLGVYSKEHGEPENCNKLFAVPSHRQFGFRVDDSFVMHLQPPDAHWCRPLFRLFIWNISTCNNIQLSPLDPHSSELSLNRIDRLPSTYRATRKSNCKVYISNPCLLNGEDMNGLDLTQLSMASYPFPFLSMSENDNSALFIPLSDDTRSFKRIKQIFSNSASAESSITLRSGGSNSSHPCSGSNNSINSADSSVSHARSNSSLKSSARLQFRDHVWTCHQRYLAAEAVEEEAAAIITSEEGRSEKDGSGDGMKLVQLLIACAEAVACRDKSHASCLLSELQGSALVLGSSFQRVASCFVQGLADRLALVQPLGAVGFISPTMNLTDVASEKKEEALRLVYEICPYIQFGRFVANASILEAFEGENYVHVVDLGMTLGLPHGHQWRHLIPSLANHPGQPPRRLQITGVGVCVERYRKIGNELHIYAESLGINLEFSVVESNLENLKPIDIKIIDGEVLVVNSILRLHRVDSSHNGPFFLGRFMEALHYYSAIFDSLDAMLPKYDTRSAKMEQFYFAEEIKNIVSCEGPARIERHERVDQWRRRMSRAGFQPSPIKTMAQAKQWLGRIRVCEGYTIVEEKGCLVLGWKSKPIVAASCWKC